MKKNSLKIQGLQCRFQFGTGFSLFIMGVMLSALVCSLFLPIGTRAAEYVKSEGENYIIVIDPGHGGDNHGTTENGALEKNMNLTTAISMKKTLSNYDGVEVFLTRENDKELSLEERAVFAKEHNADFLVSIHYNASLNHNLYGAEAWVNLKAPYHGFGYGFGKLWLQYMENYGFFLRGVKTKESETTQGKDYYGILRYCAEQEIPAVILEHGHVDSVTDMPKISKEEQQEEIGKQNAIALAEYLGLNLKDDSQEELPQFQKENAKVLSVNTEKTYLDSINLFSEPEICTISLVKEDAETGKITLEVNGADYDCPLIYYTYSLDGGNTYEDLKAWPESNVFDGTYKDTFYLDIYLPENQFTSITLRAYNMFDQYKDSNILDNCMVYHSKNENLEDSIVINNQENPQKTTDTDITTQYKEVVLLKDVKEEKKSWSLEDLSTPEISKLIHFVLLSIFVALSLVVMVCMTYLVGKVIKKRQDKK